MIRRLYVFFDLECGICCRFRQWLERQPLYVPLEMVGYQSDRAREIFPEINEHRPGEEILVVGDDGSLYRGGDAWIICLWATREYRDLSITMARPAIRPFARRMAFTVSKNRRSLSRLLHLKAEDDPTIIAAHLAPEPMRCAAPEP